MKKNQKFVQQRPSHIFSLLPSYVVLKRDEFVKKVKMFLSVNYQQKSHEFEIYVNQGEKDFFVPVDTLPETFETKYPVLLVKSKMQLGNIVYFKYVSQKEYFEDFDLENNTYEDYIDVIADNINYHKQKTLRFAN